MGKLGPPQNQRKRPRTSLPEKVKEDVRQGGRWVLRQTKIRQARGYEQLISKPPRTKDLTKNLKRPSHQVASEPGSEGSCVGENPIPVAHPDAKPFQKKGLDHYDLLAELLGNSMATGAFGHGNMQGEPTSDDEREMEELMYKMRSGKGLASETTSGSRGKKKSDGSDWDSKPMGKKCKAIRKEAAWEQIAFCQKAKGQWYENVKAKDANGEGSNNTTTQCIQLLNSMKDNVDPMQFVKAFNQLAFSSELRVAWLELDPVMRAVWVNSLI